LAITETEEKLIAALAIIGLLRIPNEVGFSDVSRRAFGTRSGAGGAPGARGSSGSRRRSI
jgi:hypothetical protein